MPFHDSQLYGVWSYKPGEAFCVGASRTLPASDMPLAIRASLSTSAKVDPVVAPSGPYIMGRLYGVAQPKPKAKPWAVGFFFPSAAVEMRSLAAQLSSGLWKIIPTPNVDVPTPAENWLHGVSGTSPSDVWAVGFSRQFPFDERSVILRWDGAAWTLTAAPSLGKQDALVGVSALSANNAWAVGGTVDYSSKQQSFILRWDGVAWNVVPGTGGPGSTGHFLVGVAAVSSGSAWAVGSALVSGTYKGLIVRWHQNQWKFARHIGSELKAVSASASNNVWAVGHKPGPLVLRYNGSTWSPQPTPLLPTDVLEGVHAVSPTDVWVAGRRRARVKSFKTLVAHWNGSTWKVLDTP